MMRRLSVCRDMWTALGPPVEAVAFDFYEAMANMQPFQAELPGRAFADGICNAVAFWFTLHLDEETEIHTGPYADKVPTKTGYFITVVVLQCIK